MTAFIEANFIEENKSLILGIMDKLNNLINSKMM